ncbi:MAG TPA: hypothetical protein VGY31_12830 [Terriglobia bacterium]|nr:hypothetical protein [Terriglobia bacterium]
MGLDVNGTRFLLYAKRLGVDFSRSAMVGRQYFSRISPSDMKRNLTEFKFVFDEDTIERIFNENKGYAEPFLQFLGAQETHSFDISGYEGATHLHDMNEEISESLKGQYSMVLDGGSLEHVFNFPMAIRNCMHMVRVGGHYLGISPTNNFMGHGFYQFSPELYFSVFTKRNGYRMVSMVAFEDKPKAKWYYVKSPSSIKGRITLTNSIPTHLLVLAQKLENAPIFQSTPQQSDYLRVWDHAGIYIQETVKSSRARSIARRFIPHIVKRWFKPEWKHYSGFDPRFFEAVDHMT